MVNVDINGGSIAVFLDEQSPTHPFSYFHPLVTHLSLSLNNNDNDNDNNNNNNDNQSTRVLELLKTIDRGFDRRLL